MKLPIFLLRSSKQNHIVFFSFIVDFYLPLIRSFFCTFCSSPLQSLEMARLARTEKARPWMLLLSGATWEASLITPCISEFVTAVLGRAAWSGTQLPLLLLLHKALHPKWKKKKSYRMKNRTKHTFLQINKKRYI